MGGEGRREKERKKEKKEKSKAKKKKRKEHTALAAKAMIPLCTVQIPFGSAAGNSKAVAGKIFRRGKESEEVVHICIDFYFVYRVCQEVLPWDC